MEKVDRLGWTAGISLNLWCARWRESQRERGSHSSRGPSPPKLDTRAVPYSQASVFTQGRRRRFTPQPAAFSHIVFEHGRLHLEEPGLTWAPRKEIIDNCPSVAIQTRQGIGFAPTYESGRANDRTARAATTFGAPRTTAH